MKWRDPVPQPPADVGSAVHPPCDFRDPSNRYPTREPGWGLLLLETQTGRQRDRLSGRHGDAGDGDGGADDGGIGCDAYE